VSEQRVPGHFDTPLGSVLGQRSQACPLVGGEHDGSHTRPLR